MPAAHSSLAPLAQLDRASGYEPEGREFESLRAHHSFKHIAQFPSDSVSCSFVHVSENVARKIKSEPALIRAKFAKFHVIRNVAVVVRD